MLSYFDHVVVCARHDEPAVVLDTPDGGDVAEEDVEALAGTDVPDAKRSVT